MKRKISSKLGKSIPRNLKNSKIARKNKKTIIVKHIDIEKLIKQALKE